MARLVTFTVAVGTLVISAGASAQPSSQRWSNLEKTAEEAALRRSHGRGELLDVFEGGSDTPIVIGVHGLRGAPSDLASVLRKEAQRGNAVKVFAYDDKFHSLEDSSADLAAALDQLLEIRPDATLRLDAHSMGGRVALAALGILARRRTLTDRMTVNLMASPIAGTTAAAFSRWAPGFIPWIRAIHGIAAASAFQQRIDQLRLPNGVVHVFVGGKDRVFDYSTERYADVVRNLGGTLTVFEGASHMTVLDEVAKSW